MIIGEINVTLKQLPELMALPQFHINKFFTGMYAKHICPVTCVVTLTICREQALDLIKLQLEIRRFRKQFHIFPGNVFL